MAKMTGSKIMLESLKKEGVELLFGYPGGQIMPFFDALYDGGLKTILVRHEQAAAHMADGYARTTGKVGVCVATSGPGATNLVTGIANAYMDSIPIVAITGQVSTGLIGNDAFQEADIIGITRPIVKHSYMLKKTDEIAQVVKNAFHIARTGRPGPVVIDFPRDVQVGEAEFVYPSEPSLRGYKPNYEGHPKMIKKAAEMIEKAERPIVYVGGGIISSNACDEMVKFAEKINSPVTTTLMALGSIPSDHPLNLGMLGMHGTKYANYAIQESDLIIAVGARFDDRVTGKVSDFAPHADIIHIDIDPTAISKIIKVDLPIVGDAKNILKELTSEVKKLDRSPWLTQVGEWKKEYPLSYRDSDTVIKPQYVLEKINELTKGNAFITTEVGQHQMWAAQFLKFNKPRTFITSGGLGTMGFGFPAALGVQAGNPDSLVLCIAGDGSIQMNIQELATAVINKYKVKVIILNNSWLGMVRQWQELFWQKRYSHTDISNSVDFVKVAEAYGAKGMRIEKKEDVVKALKEAFDYEGPVFMDFRVAREENVWPMVPAGAPLGNMIEGELA